MAEQYQHRGYDPAGLEYVYWLSENPWDITGVDYTGPPAFGTLTGIAVVQVFPDAAAAFMLLRIEDTTPDDLNVFEEI